MTRIASSATSRTGARAPSVGPGARADRRPLAFAWGMLDPVSGAHMAQRSASGSRSPRSWLSRMSGIALRSRCRSAWSQPWRARPPRDPVAVRDRSSAHPVAQVEHPGGPHDHVGVLEQVRRVDPAEEALAGRRARRARRPCATSSTSPAASIWPPTSPAATSIVRSPASACASADRGLYAVDEAERRVRVPSLGRRPVRHDDHVVDAARRGAAQPSVRSKTRRPTTGHADLVPVRPRHLGAGCSRTFELAGRRRAERPRPVNQSNSGPGWSRSSAMNPSTDTVLYRTTLPTCAPSSASRGAMLRGAGAASRGRS